MQVLNFENNTSELSFISQDFPFSFTKEYATSIRSQYRFLIFKRHEIVIPAIIKQSAFLKTIQFQFKPLTVLAKEIEPTQESEFINEVIQYITQHKIAHRILQPANFSLFTSITKNSIYCEFGTYQINLTQFTDEQLLLNMQPRYRTSIRAAMALNPEIRIGIDELVPFWNLHKETLARTNMYFEPFEELQKIQQAMPSNTLVATIYLNNEIQGGVFITYTKYGAYYLHGASCNTSKSDGVVKYLHYWCMCYFKKLGVSKYDFVGARTSNVSGTKLEGIQNFKKRLGGKLTKGYLWKKDISPLVCKAYDSLLLLKLKLRGKSVPLDIIDQENKK